MEANTIINPSKTTKIILKLIGILCLCFGIYQIVRDYGLIEMLFTEKRFDWVWLVYLMILSIPFLTGFLFFVGNKWGWILLMLMSTNSIGIILIHIHARYLLELSPLTKPYIPDLGYFESILLALLPALVYYISRQEIRSIFKIVRNIYLVTVITAMTLCSILIFLYLCYPPK